ncbi:MAG: GIY-YIG nuclease family protein [Roseiflexus sp.]
MPARGTYLLMLRINRDITGLPVGKLGALDFPAGYYLYVGSAFGPGGIPARLAHHAKRRKTRPHWHIDYLRALGDVEEAWSISCPVRLEQAWVSALSAAPDVRSVAPGFGAGDSPCASHLFFSPIRPSPLILVETLFQGIEKVVDCITHVRIEVHTFHDHQFVSVG